MSKRDEPYLSLVEPWSVTEEGTLLETRVFAVRQRRCTSPTNPEKTGLFYYLDGGDWVNVVAVTEDEQVVCIEQFRHGRKEITLEIPGGMVDPGETPLQAGVRELAEETGFTSEQPAQIIGVVSPNPAIQSNLCHTVLVRGVARTRELDLDAGEEIETRLVPVGEVFDLIRAGTIHHALVVAALHHYALLASATSSKV